MQGGEGTAEKGEDEGEGERITRGNSANIHVLNWGLVSMGDFRFLPQLVCCFRGAISFLAAVRSRVDAPSYPRPRGAGPQDISLDQL